MRIWYTLYIYSFNLWQWSKKNAPLLHIKSKFTSMNHEPNLPSETSAFTADAAPVEKIYRYPSLAKRYKAVY